MSNTPSKKDVDDLVYALRQKGDDSTYALVVEAIAKWGTPQPVVRDPLPKFSALKFHARRDQKATVTLLFQDSDTANAWVKGITQKGGSNGATN